MALDTIPKQEGGKLKAVASGTLPSGVPVVVNADGTVSVIEGVTGGTGTPVVFAAYNSTHQAAVFDSSNNKVVVAYSQDASPQYGYAVVGTVSGTSISFGTPVVFHSGETTLTFAVFDSNSNKVVITYRDGGASNYGKAVVGTVSGTSISFGSEATFNSGDTDYPAATFDSNSNKVVITYRDTSNSNYGTAIVGTVSGTSISFGSETVFESQRVDYVFPTFDSVNNKVVVAYRVFSGNREGYAKVGTVSGTSISFGSSVQFEAGQTNHIKSTFDSSNDKVVLFYRDDNNSDQGTAIVGTVSGTSISFGTPVIFSTTSVDQLSAVFNTSSNKIFIGYTDYGNSSYGTLIAGTVSGTSISFEDKIIFEDSNTFYTNLAFDSTSNAIVAAYRNTANSSYGTAAVYKPSSTNLTSENYIGMSTGGSVADGDNATVDIVGTVNKEQSGLTAGQQYYVQTDGTIGTTPADPSVLAGTAVSATKMVVKS